MGIGNQLNSELSSWGILAILLVIFMIVLNKIKTTSSGAYICDSSVGGVEYAYFNTTGNICCNGTASTLTSCAGSLNQTAVNTMGSTADDFITGLSEPKNWVAIFVIALIGFGIIKYVKSKN